MSDIQQQMIRDDENNLLYQVRQAVGYFVDKEELLKALNYDRDQYQKGYHDGLNADKWIPVSERLPEDGRPVLIYAWNVHHVIARYDSFRTENGYKKCWVTADAWNGNMEIKHDVIAWMPLPEPYKAESEG